MALPTHKIKPYTVIDLSTRTVLSEDEINEVLNEASEKQYLKSIGQYAYNGNHAKANGDPPNFLLLPRKKRNRSKSLDSLYNTHPSNCRHTDDSDEADDDEQDENVDESGTYQTNKSTEYAVFRRRANTAPLLEVHIANSTRRRKGPRLTVPSSPGSAKRKVLQKLQQQQQQRQQLLDRNARQQIGIPSPKGFYRQVPQNMAQKQSGLRMPSSRSKPAEQPRSQSALRGPTNNKNSQSAQRSTTLPRYSSKTPEAKYQERKTSSNNDIPATSLRASNSTSGLQQPKTILSSKSNNDISATYSKPIASGLQQPKSIPKPSLQSRSFGSEKRSLESLRASREKSAESLRSAMKNKQSAGSLASVRREKSAENFIDSNEIYRKNSSVRHEKSVENFIDSNEVYRKSSSSSLPHVRTKQSVENLLLSRENTSESINSNISDSVDSVDLNQHKNCMENSTSKTFGLRKSTSAPKVPSSSALKALSAKSGLPQRNNPTSGNTLESRLKNPSIEKPSGLVKPKPGIPGNPEVKISGIPSNINTKKPVIPSNSEVKKSGVPFNQDAKKFGVSSNLDNKKSATPKNIAIGNCESMNHTDTTIKSEMTNSKNPERNINTITKLDTNSIKNAENNVNNTMPKIGMIKPTAGYKSLEKTSLQGKLKRPIQFKPNNTRTNITFQTQDKSNFSSTVIANKESSADANDIDVSLSTNSPNHMNLENSKNSNVNLLTNATSENVNLSTDLKKDVKPLVQREESIQSSSPDSVDGLSPSNLQNGAFLLSTLPNDPFSELDTDPERRNFNFETPTPEVECVEPEFTKHRNSPSSNKQMKQKKKNAEKQLNRLSNGYSESEDNMKRSDELSADSGYIEPALDSLSITSTSSNRQLTKQISNTSSSTGYPDETSSSNESNPSPRFGEVSFKRGDENNINKYGDNCYVNVNKCKESKFESDSSNEKNYNSKNHSRLNISENGYDNAADDRSGINKGNGFQTRAPQGKIVIPPPQLQSYNKAKNSSDGDDLLAPIPNEYMRTPSSDIDECQLMRNHHGSATLDSDFELRRRAREEAIRVWKKTNTPEAFGVESEDEDREDVSGELDGEEDDADVFYPSKNLEHKSNTLERYATRTSIRRSSDDDDYYMEENIRQLEQITNVSERKEKKTWKLKKFFKKLSSKKENNSSNNNNNNKNTDSSDIAAANFLRNPKDRQQNQQELDEKRLSTSSSSNYDILKTRRKSDGTLSMFSIQNDPVTPLTKRRLFAINLSFMKRGRRQRSNTTLLSTNNNPSHTVRALCSPEMSRKNQFTAIATNGRRASDPSIYRIQHHTCTGFSGSGYRVPTLHKNRPKISSSPVTCTMTLTHSPITITMTSNSSHTTDTFTSSCAHVTSDYVNVTYKTTPTRLPTKMTGHTTTTSSPIDIPHQFPGKVPQHSSSSDNEEGDYINYPFSKANLKPPQKPLRGGGSKGSCSDPPYQSSGHKRSNSACGGKTVHGVAQSQNSGNNHTNNKGSVEMRHSSVASDDSFISSGSFSSASGDVFDHNLNARPSRTKESLRRTPLRNSIDSYTNLLEVHKQTIDKIAFEVSRLVCPCEKLQGSGWDDFDRKSEVLQLGMESYMVLPVSSSKCDQKSFTAWLRLSQPIISLTQGTNISSPIPLENVTSSNKPPVISTQFLNYSKTTLHRNCLHVCHMIEPAYAQPTDDALPKSIEVKTALISPQLPRMTLSKYVAMTMEKHTRYAEQYEREVALILLQVAKGVTHMLKKGVPLKFVGTENIFVLNTGDTSVILSPRKRPNKCPAVVVAHLPGLGDACKSNSSIDQVTNICHQLAFLLYELLHSPYEEELRLVVNSPMLFTTLPDLTIKSIYSRYLQSVIDKLLGSTTHSMNSLNELILTLEVVLFGPTNISDHSKKDGIVLIQKWHNRRCVDMVTHILKEAPLIMLCASEHQGQEVERIKSVDQEILLECEFLSTVLPVDVFDVSKELRR